VSHRMTPAGLIDLFMSDTHCYDPWRQRTHEKHSLNFLPSYLLRTSLLLHSKKRQLCLLNLKSTLSQDLFEASKIVSTELFMTIGTLSSEETSYIHDLGWLF